MNDKSSTGAATAIIIGVAGIVVAVIFGVVSHLDATSGTSSGAVGADHANDPTPHASSTAPSATDSSVPPDTVPSPTTPSPAVIPPPTFGSIEVTTLEGFPGAGKRIGPDSYQMDVEAQIAYNWRGVMSDGSSNKGRTCQILGTVTGPQALEPFRTDYCSNANVNGFSGDQNIFRVKTPGTYTVTVLDQITGISGTKNFTVVR